MATEAKPKSQRQFTNMITGLCGEYYAAAMVFKNNWIATLTQKNYPSVDLFAFNPKTSQHVQAQIKTSSKKVNNFLVGVKHNTRILMDSEIKGPYIFIHLGDTIDCYILSKSQFIEVVNRTDDIYYNKPRVKPIKDDYPIAVSIKDLLPYKDQWDNLWKD